MTQAHDDAHGPAHDHDHGHEDGDAYHATYRGYLTGFALSLVLTALPFWLVMGKGLPSPVLTSAAVLAFAAVQVVVHMLYFLHMNAKVEQGWSLLALIFTGVLVVIMLAGSVWVMHHLNTNMMPAHEMKNLP